MIKKIISYTALSSLSLSIGHGALFKKDPSFSLNLFSTKSSQGSLSVGSSLTLNGGTFNNSGSAFFEGGSINLYSGNLNNINGANFATCVSRSFLINGSTVSTYNDSLSKLGPFQLVMQDGNIQNQGTMYLDLLVNQEGSWTRQVANSSINGGVIQGSGQMWISGNTSLASNLSQGQLYIGQGVNLQDLTSPENTYGSLNLNGGVVDAPFIITSRAILQGNGTLNQKGTIYGQLFPGPNAQNLGDITFNSDLALVGNASSLCINVNNKSASAIVVNGKLSLDPATIVYIKEVVNQPRGYSTYTLANNVTSTSSLPSLINQSGNPNQFELVYDGNNLLLNIGFPAAIPAPPASAVANPSLAQMAATLNTLDGKCPPATQALINLVINLPPEEVAIVLAQLVPVFKKAQYVFEKLDLAIGEELRDNLYEKTDQLKPFVMIGYDNIHQMRYPSFAGYNSQTYYEIVGATFGPKYLRGQAAIGLGQIYLNTIPKIAHSSIYSAYLNGGLAANFNYFSLGVDVLGSYGRIIAQRTIAFFNAVAKNKHNLWNFSYTGKGELHILKKKLLFDAYAEMGQNFGKENPYLETGATGINQFVWKEKINVFRTAVGFRFSTPSKNILSCFLDGAWVYDYYRNSKSFYAAFEGTNIYSKYSDFYPPNNLTRIRAGLSLNYKRLGTNLSYSSLFGKRFSENTGEFNLKINY